MRLAAITALTLACAACGGGGANMTPPPQEPPPREPIAAAEVVARWENLAKDEAEVVRSIDEMAGVPGPTQLEKLGRARQGAGFIAAGLASFVPPAELGVCHQKGIEGAKELKAALDGINDLWSGKSSADRRTEAPRLADAICSGAGKLAAGRAACGVQAKVPSPALCAQ